MLLKAPRRFGKSTVMYHLYENPEPGYRVFFQDTEGMRGPEDFISGIMAGLLVDSKFRKSINVAAKWIKNIVRHVDEVGIADIRIKIREGIKQNWQEKGKELISSLKGCDYNIIILDELPILVQNIERKYESQVALDFLLWFRRIRQMPELSNVRWVVGGSIGIEHILERIRAGTKTINDFHILSIGPFSHKDGKAYIKALLQNEGQTKLIKNETVEKILEVIGAPVPYFIQILVYESLNEMRRKGLKSLNNKIIDKAYQNEVLGPASRTYFEHYFTRLRDYYDENIEQVAKRLILEVARQGKVNKTELFKLFRQVSKGKLHDETFSHLMTDIENDFYVSYDVETKSYSFTTNILRDWWLRYYDLVEE